MNGIAGQLLIGAVGGLVAALITSVLTLYVAKLNLDHARESERLADARRLRDARRERLVASIETVLHASLVVAQVVSEDRRIWQSEAVEARDARHAEMLEQSSVGINEARVSLMTQSVTKELLRVVDEDVLTVFERYKSAYSFDKMYPDTDAHKELGTEYKLLQAGIEKLRTEVVRTVDEMEEPIPGSSAPSGLRTSLRQAKEWLRR